MMFEFRNTLLEESQFQSLMPLIQDEKSTIEAIVLKTVGEEEVFDMTMEEMKQITKEETFVASFTKKVSGNQGNRGHFSELDG